VVVHACSTDGLDGSSACARLDESLAAGGGEAEDELAVLQPAPLTTAILLAMGPGTSPPLMGDNDDFVVTADDAAGVVALLSFEL
jgi:hypothetical protein